MAKTVYATDMAVSRPASRKIIARAFSGERAQTVLREAGFGQGVEVLGFTCGQFSFVDLIEAVLSFTGPATFVLSTWAASVADLGRLTLFCDDGRMTLARFLLDGAFESYNKAASQDLRDRFGDENIRVIPNHAKFALISNDGWHVVIQTSMNLNQNRRIESFNVCDDKVLFDAFEQVVGRVFALQPVSAGFGRGGYRASSNTLSALGASRDSGFYDVTPGVALFDGMTPG